VGDVERARTLINKAALEQLCHRLPECRTFLENFFGSCSSFDYDTNRANYLLDLELYKDRPYVRKHRRALEQAFASIAQRSSDKSEERKPYLAAQLDQYLVTVWGDLILAIDGDGNARKRVASGLQDLILRANCDVMIGLGRTRHFEIVYVYQRSDGYGYAFNLDAPDLSEWGYAPKSFSSG